MKNKALVWIYLFLLIVVVFFSYRFYTASSSMESSKVILELNTTTLNSYYHRFLIPEDSGYIWGIKKPKKIEKILKEVTEKKTRKIEQDNTKICIDDNCYRFLGIYYKAKTPFIVFYNKNFKKGLRNFHLDEFLFDTVYLKKLEGRKLFLEDNKTKEMWQFKFFDVNATQYKPKDINETDI
jgi:hypothetical protein